MKRWEKFTKEEIECFVKESKNYVQLAQKIGYNESPNNGSAYRAVHQMIDELSLDVSHFTGQRRNKNKVDIDKYKQGRALNSGQALRDLIILRSKKCEQCGLTEWQGQEIPLEVHHKDGNHLNSELSNLVLLCRNCHALTKNYGSKNRRSEVDDKTLIRALQTTSNIRQALIKVGLTGKGKNYDRCYNLIYKYNITQLGDEKTKSIKKRCKKCGRSLSSSKFDICQNCFHESRRACKWPSKEELKEKIYTKSFLQIGKEYNVSDSAVRKWCKYYSIPYRKKDIKQYTYEEWKSI